MVSPSTKKNSACFIAIKSVSRSGNDRNPGHRDGEFLFISVVFQIVFQCSLESLMQIC